MAVKPFESKIQNLVYNVDVGIGLRLIKTFLFVLGMLIVMLLYIATQFHGLKDAAAMDSAQLGRNLAQKGRYVTDCIRPAGMWYLIENLNNPKLGAHPELIQPPLWPATLAAAFKLSNVSFGYSVSAGGVFSPEKWIVVPVGMLFTALTALMIFFLGKRLFDRRIALLATLIYCLSDAVLSDGISGLGIPLVSFLTTTAFFAVLVAGDNRRAGLPAHKWLIPLSIAVVACALAFLTKYAAWVLAPAIAMYVGLFFDRKRWMWACGVLLAFLVCVSPWLVRNKLVSGGFFGLAPYMALNDTASFAENGFERTLAPSLTVSGTVNMLQAKMMTKFREAVDQPLRMLGEGLLASLFLTALFYRFIKTPVHALRWCVVLSMILLLIVGTLFGPGTTRLINIFWPIVIIYGLAFFFILLDRLQLRIRLFNLAVITLFVIVSAMPFILTMMPPRQGIPYPPYYPAFVVYVSNMLNQNEVICTDMPWATAWYGGKTSLLLPASIEEFYEIHDYYRRISAMYFTTLTRNKPYVRGLVTGPERSWFPLLEGRIPSDFPFVHGFPLSNMDQLFLTDSVRWKQQ